MTMKALQYVEIGKPPRVMEVDKPTPGPGQVLLKVTAAGACHSDEFVMSLPEEAYVYGLPLTLGHEGAGIVEEVGAGVSAVAVGDAVAVYGPWGCGVCPACARGEENYCHVAAERHIVPPGLGAPGAMAEYLLVDDERHLVPLGDLDPVQNVSLTDAGLTPYHAIKPSLPALVPGSVAVVIGAGASATSASRSCAPCHRRRSSRSTSPTRSCSTPGTSARTTPSAPTSRLSNRSGR
jgi:propanol-preferring alcohol dehydrogenase